MKDFIFGIILLTLLLLIISQYARAEYLPCEQVGEEFAQASNDFGHCQKILSKTNCCVDMAVNYVNADMELYYVQVDDLEKPIYDRQNIQSCNSYEECNELTAPVCVEAESSIAEKLNCVFYCDDFKDYYLKIDEFTAFCEKQIGYEKKDEVRSRVNESKKAARLALEAQKEAERVQKELEKENATKELKKSLNPDTINLIKYLEIK